MLSAALMTTRQKALAWILLQVCAFLFFGAVAAGIRLRNVRGWNVALMVVAAVLLGAGVFLMDRIGFGH
jgi:hypothetical protein